MLVSVVYNLFGMFHFNLSHNCYTASEKVALEKYYVVVVLVAAVVK